MNAQNGISEEIPLGKDSPIEQAGTQIIIFFSASFRVFRVQNS